MSLPGCDILLMQDEGNYVKDIWDLCIPSF